MTRIFGFLKNRWVTSILGLLAVSILIWYLGPLIAIAGSIPLQSEIARLITIIVCILLWGFNNLRVQAAVNKANTSLIDESGEVSSPVSEAEPSRSAEEVALLKNRFNDALKTLRTSSTKRGAASLYELPWYLIIGPPGSGKTTALLKSGLSFPLADKFGEGSIRGVAGTRNCDWWFSEEAVLLDTAGRYTTQDSDAQTDSAAWKGFLKLLKKYRSRRPINGALVTISLQDLLTQSEAERTLQINAIRQRLQELTQQLGVRFPVYVVFTKCDLISGFMEFFDDLGSQDRGQVWGVSFSLVDGLKETNPTRNFVTEYDLLIERMNSRLLWKLQQERDSERRAKIFEFPQQMASLKMLISNFLDGVFVESRYEDPLLLRGAYFISSTQEGSPIDRVMGSLARVFNIGSQSIRPFRGDGRSYFVNRLLRDVIFEEAELASANGKLERKRAWLQRGAYTGALLVIVLMVLAWSTSFTRNQMHIFRFQNALENYQNVVDGQAMTIASNTFDWLPERLGAIRAVTEIYRPFEGSTPVLMGFGLYPGDRLTATAMDLYRQELNNFLLPAAQERIEREVITSRENPELQYEALKTYLMLGNEDRLDPNHLKNWMATDWRALFPDQPVVQGQFQEHMDALLEYGIGPMELNGEVVESARRNLESVSLAELLYGRIKRDYDGMSQTTNPLRLIDMTGPGGEAVFQRRSGTSMREGLSRFFTYEGYHDYFSGQLTAIAAKAADEAWVLNPGQEVLLPAEILQLQQSLREHYFEEFIDTWDSLLGDIQVVSFQSPGQAKLVLEAMVAANSPIRNLLREVSRHTNLASGGILGSVVEAVGDAQSQNSLERLRQASSGSDTTVAVTDPERLVSRHFSDLNALLAENERGRMNNT